MSEGKMTSRTEAQQVTELLAPYTVPPVSDDLQAKLLADFDALESQKPSRAGILDTLSGGALTDWARALRLPSTSWARVFAPGGAAAALSVLGLVSGLSSVQAQSLDAAATYVDQELMATSSVQGASLLGEFSVTGSELWAEE